MGLVLSATHMFMLGSNGWSAGQIAGETPSTDGSVTGSSVGEAGWECSEEPPCSIGCCACAEAPWANRNVDPITNAIVLCNLGMSFSSRALHGMHWPSSKRLLPTENGPCDASLGL